MQRQPVSDSPYAPPTAELSVSDNEPLYFSVGRRKLALMSVCTFGLYELYWFYRNWKCVKRNEQSDIWPIPRTIFAALFGYALARSVRDHALRLAVPVELSPVGLGLIYLLMTVLVQLPDPYWLISVFTFAPLVLIQDAADQVLAATSTSEAALRRFSAWNWAALVGGTGLWILTLLDLMIGAVS